MAGEIFDASLSNRKRNCTDNKPFNSSGKVITMNGKLDILLGKVIQ